MEFRRSTLIFAPTVDAGPDTQAVTLVFPRNVLRAVAGIAGFSTGFGQPSDRRLGLLDIGATSSIDAATVTVDVSFGVRDWTGEWDDPYAGVVDVAVVAELEPANAPPARTDLQITGMEITQVTQFFRSGDHLDADNVMPDNSVPLIASKPTGVRVYVDYDDTQGLPPITDLSGELEVQTRTGSALIAPLASIVPQRDAAIDRGQAAHTLNFLVDAALCTSDVTLRCRVFDAADTTQQSAAITRSCRFQQADEVRLFVVGVNYTGQGLNLPAPSLATFLNDVPLLESTFPTPAVITTGYATIDNFSVDMNASTPCASGFSALNELIADLKGDSDDIYVGAIPAGVNFGSFSGCASKGVASGAIGSQLILAHEVGHRYGRPHAPCDSAARCDNPSGQDSVYPKYGNYVSDSIGEFGYDPLTGRVYDPANSFDLMGYTNRNSWVSPHTYTALMARTAPVAGGAGGGAAALSLRGVWQRVRSMTLFLELRIGRDDRVERRPSFAFPAVPDPKAPHGGCGGGCGGCGGCGGITVEFLDTCHNVLGCHGLADETGCGARCWPQAVRAALPLPPGARWLVVWRARCKLYEECIPEPPVVSIDCNATAGADGFRLDWAASGADACDIWYLVQWEDLDGTWRGLAPRTRTRSTVLPGHLMGGRTRMRVRVLATSGLATGSAQCILVPPTRRPRAINVVLTGAGGGPIDPVPAQPVPVGRGGLRAWAVDEAGRSMPAPDFAWFDAAGRQIARGPRMTTNDLRGTAEVRLLALGLRSRRAAPPAHHWTITRAGQGLSLSAAPARGAGAGDGDDTPPGDSCVQPA